MTQKDPRRLSRLPIPFKVLYTSYLIVIGFGLLMAFMQILLTHGMADGEFGLSKKDIIYSYYGNRGSSRLEAKLSGTMKDKATAKERAMIVEWVRAGSDRETWNRSIAPIMSKKCVICHSPGNNTIPSLARYEDVKSKAQIDEGASIEALTRFSHIHLFGIAFIYFFVAYIFAQCSNLPVWFQSGCIAAPFVFLVLDFMSWWMTKWYPGFAVVTIISGTANAVASALMVNISLHQMWFPLFRSKVKEVSERTV